IIEPVSKKKTTRWQELKRLAAALIEYVTSIQPAGIDLYFLNRGTLQNVHSVVGLQETFAMTPTDQHRTPLLGKLRQIYAEKAKWTPTRPPGADKLLIICVTDGVPTDGTKEQLEEVISSKP